eukprot:TRINITY_DN4110_c0_g1_i2.p1 TRINITY_DN4110_c0_g1~~TRINITY_DN4110_c0_g1_i2.p1  ORF type:complete len:461 (-),score=108.26 TRINITY_DN4110_c0_g1_i2:113-1345(-)
MAGGSLQLAPGAAPWPHRAPGGGSMALPVGGGSMALPVGGGSMALPAAGGSMALPVAGGAAAVQAPRLLHPASPATLVAAQPHGLPAAPPHGMAFHGVGSALSPVAPAPAAAARPAQPLPMSSALTPRLASPRVPQQSQQLLHNQVLRMMSAPDSPATKASSSDVMMRSGVVISPSPPSSAAASPSRVPLIAESPSPSPLLSRPKVPAAPASSPAGEQNGAASASAVSAVSAISAASAIVVANGAGDMSKVPPLRMMSQPPPQQQRRVSICAEDPQAAAKAALAAEEAMQPSPRTRRRVSILATPRERQVISHVTQQRHTRTQDEVSGQFLANTVDAFFASSLRSNDINLNGKTKKCMRAPPASTVDHVTFGSKYTSARERRGTVQMSPEEVGELKYLYTLQGPRRAFRG